MVQKFKPFVFAVLTPDTNITSFFVLELTLYLKCCCGGAVTMNIGDSTPIDSSIFKTGIPNNNRA